MPRSQHTQSELARDRYGWAVCGALFLSVALIYGQTLGFGFLDYDDSGFVYDENHVTAGLTVEGLRWAMTSGPYGEWCPLSTLSHMLDCELFGLHAWGHHLTNLLLHAAASIALFRVLRQMTGELWPSAFVAAVFAVHPQHVESVAWIAERRDVLSGLCFTLTLAAYLGYVRHGRSLGRYGLVVVALVLGLMAKPMLVSLPPLLLLLDFWPLARIGAPGDAPDWTRSHQPASAVRLVLEKLPLVALAALGCLMALSTHNRPSVQLPWSVRAGNAAVACVTYVMQMFWPVDLHAFYPLPHDGQPTWKAVGAILALMAVSAATVIGRRQWPYLFVGWFWYLGMLSPVLGIVAISEHLMADRYMYLPGIGLYIAVAWGVTRLLAGRLAGDSAGRGLLAGAAGLVIVALTATAIEQTSFWHDEEALWGRVLSFDPDNERAELGVADALARRNEVDRAIELYLRAQQRTGNVRPLNNLGTLLRNQGRLDEAIGRFRQGLEIDPNSFRLCVNLAAALAQQGHSDEAVEMLHRALQIDPRGSVAYVTWAHVLIGQRKFDEARSKLEAALAVDPLNASTHCDLGAILFQQGQVDASIREFKAALAIDPSLIVAHETLAAILEAAGRIPEAEAQRQGLRALRGDASAGSNRLDSRQGGEMGREPASH